jgi:hypothetical protein
MGNITIKSVWQATVEEIVADLTYWGDHPIVISVTETGRIRVHMELYPEIYEDNTLKSALIRMGSHTNRINSDPVQDNTMVSEIWDDEDFLVLDWRDAKLPIQVQ